jgi:hypothetical protein
MLSLNPFVAVQVNIQRTNMKKKWIVIPSLLVLTVVVAAAAMPLWRPFWEAHRPREKIVIDGAMRREVIDTLVTKLNTYYVFPDKAAQIVALLRQRQQEGKYDGITDGEQLAKRLTDDMASVAHDGHMAVDFDPGVVPAFGPMGPPPATRAEWERTAPLPLRLFAHVSSLGLEKVDHLSPGSAT